MLEICQFGAGRIGAIHAANIAASGRARLRYVVDVHPGAAEALASKYGARALTSPEVALADSAVQAVVIASSTDTHVDLISRSARAGKAIFCEKPIDLELARVETCLAELEHTKVPFFIAFNRRFDPSFKDLHDRVRRGEIGRLETLTITSRDPRPPAIEYVRVSGGLFRDMMIHDFDMACWILGEPPVELSAFASCLIEPAIGRAGDVDTAMVTLRTASGALAHIVNSRRAVYGYDQRIEAFGEKGLIQAGNRLENTVARWSTEGILQAKPLDFFLERYADAYRSEMLHFLRALESHEPFATSAEDGRRALLLAEAALESQRTGRAVPLRH